MISLGIDGLKHFVSGWKVLGRQKQVTWYMNMNMNGHKENLHTSDRDWKNKYDKIVWHEQMLKTLNVVIFKNCKTNYHHKVRVSCTLLIWITLLYQA